jgi:hypothetical protein
VGRIASGKASNTSSRADCTVREILAKAYPALLEKPESGVSTICGTPVRVAFQMRHYLCSEHRCTPQCITLLT